MLTATEIRVTESDDSQFETVYLARQPIINSSGALAAYELLFRTANGAYCSDVDGMDATANVIRNAFFGLGIPSVLSGTVGFINVDERFLCSELVEALQPRSVVLEILETVEPSPPLMARLCELRALGYRFALDDYVGDYERVAPFLPFTDVVKFDILALSSDAIAHAIEQLNKPAIRLLAEKVETAVQFEETKRLGFTLFQGFHFARPQALSGRDARTPHQSQLLQLIGMLRDDRSDREILDELKRHPTVAIRMLAVANSSAMGMARPVHSLTDALAALGRKHVLRIINILLFAGDGASGLLRNPLFQTSCARGRLLEQLALVDDAMTLEESDGAFLVGMLSLVDGLMAQPMHLILPMLNLSEVLMDALLLRKGRLGELLTLAEMLEVAQDEGVRTGMTRLPHLSGSDLMRIQLEAFAWAGEVARS